MHISQATNKGRRKNYLWPCLTLVFSLFLLNKRAGFLFAPGTLAALELVKSEPERRQRLWDNTYRLQEGLRYLGFDIGPSKTPIVPVLIGPLEKTFLFWRKLFDAGVFTNPIAPPAVPSEACRQRDSLIATHTTDQIDRCMDAFEKVGRELGII